VSVLVPNGTKGDKVSCEFRAMHRGGKGPSGHRIASREGAGMLSDLLLKMGNKGFSPEMPEEALVCGRNAGA
jgi:hypothetical protein